MSKAHQINKRPTSPHLQIYKYTLSMILSILHRITGVALYLSAFFLCLWLSAAAMGVSEFEAVQSFFGSPLGMIILMGGSWALVHHALGGIKHFIWDFGLGFEEKSRHMLSYMVAILSFAITLVIWMTGFASF